MASEKAKELAAKQKAEVKAAKLAKKNSTDPRDWPWHRQLWQTYKVTAEVDKQLNLFVAAAFVGPILIGVIIGIFAPPLWLWLPLGVMAGATAGLWVLLDRAKKATFIRYAGQALDLTRYEYGLLEALLQRPGAVLSRAQLMDRVWADALDSGDRTVDTHIKTLRAKLRDADGSVDGVADDAIRTHRGLGYSVEVGAA